MNNAASARRKRTAIGATMFAVAIAAAACSSSGSKGGVPATTPTTSSTPARPSGPAADVSEELTGGKGVFIGSANTAPLDGSGYVEHEYVAAGNATSYRAVGALGRDGRWNVTPATTAPYRTRILVRRPADPGKANGTVVVEWLNVSGGVDAGPDFDQLREELLREGDTWVGVSVQFIGVMGGPVLVGVSGAASVAGKGLVHIDPVRYGGLKHPGDAYAYDVYTQVARAVRAGGDVLGGIVPKRVIAAGESQSAFALVTYVDGVQPLTHAFDGFFVHSRGGTALPLEVKGKYADIAGSIGGTPTIFRTDTDVPILDVQTESDITSVLNSYAARQPDSDRFRLWEMPGTAHADAHLLGATAKSIDCGVPINDGPAHVVLKAAFHALDAWVRDGTAPPQAPRISVRAGATPEIERDADGIAKGGIRTPPVDVPVDVLSGVPGPSDSVICLLLGSTKPLPAARIAQLYPTRADYEQQYDARADAAIKAGYVLAADRDALLAYAQPDRIGG